MKTHVDLQERHLKVTAVQNPPAEADIQQERSLGAKKRALGPSPGKGQEEKAPVSHAQRPLSSFFAAEASRQRFLAPKLSKVLTHRDQSRIARPSTWGTVHSLFVSDVFADSNAGARASSR